MAYHCLMSLKITGPRDAIHDFRELGKVDGDSRGRALVYRNFEQHERELGPTRAELVTDLEEVLVYKLLNNATPDPFILYASMQFPTLEFDCHCEFQGVDWKPRRYWGKNGDTYEQET